MKTLISCSSVFSTNYRPSLSRLVIESLPLCHTVDHELGDNENGLLGDHSVEAHQSFVLQLLHQVGLREKRLGLHSSLLQGLDGNLLGVLVVTCSRN